MSDEAISRGHLVIVGLGPGSRDLLAPRAVAGITASELVVGYRGYLKQIADLLGGKEVRQSELTQEVERATFAVEQARAGRRVCIVSSGDAGIYGMAGLVLDLLQRDAAGDASVDTPAPEVDVVPGISALNAAAALLGAPLMHDFAAISLSDLLTPWETIARRLNAAAAADFVIALYNPASKRRKWHLMEARRILLEHRAPTTPVGLVRNAYRADQRVTVVPLSELDVEAVDMFTTVIIGASSTRFDGKWMVTPRGYERRATSSDAARSSGPSSHTQAESERQDDSRQ